MGAHWCPPCRGFTPKLVEAYAGLKEKGFEVVFVSSDQDEEAWKGYYGEMPWLAVPFEDRDRKEKLSERFKASGIPTLVILNSNGELITTDGRAKVMTEPENFPWQPKPFSEVIGNSFVGKDGAVLGKEAIQGKTLGLYFSAHWCPPCRGFTPKLSETYKKVKAEHPNFEIVFVSSDRDQESWKEYYDSMPWLAIP